MPTRIPFLDVFVSICNICSSPCETSIHSASLFVNIRWELFLQLSILHVNRFAILAPLGLEHQTHKLGVVVEGEGSRMLGNIANPFWPSRRKGLCAGHLQFI